ncbi:ABC transporter permease [Metabacillus litoralis]|uniref:ABC transporter permease n=1 Tax=Metabacillus litoralis TaxID=152268 RepID=UPI000EF607B1|nr:ABC transporter permease [Metabacillus litoralis]MCM3160083.1 ABC transporter permease [Metabacillus litoralis]MCM3408667.1 ABC transporter permease [Metabacillus litoralis]UHA59672.1 ABC transporter permease [Metabacillus litoralis]
MRVFKKYGASSTLTILLLIVWEIGARLLDMKFILPTPTDVVLKIWELRVPLFLEHLPATFLIILIGLSLSILFGVGLAVWMSINKTVEKTFYPLIISSQTIPIIALAPIFVLWFGYTIWSKVVVTVLITFFPITVNTYDGLRATTKEYKDLLRTMGATKKDIFFKLQVPGSASYFFSGLKVAVTLSVIGAAIGEWIGAQAGLGYFSRRMMTQFDGAGVFAPIIILSAVGIFLFVIVSSLEKKTLKWRKTE